jgi:flagellar motor switch protein FliN/FliY
MPDFGKNDNANLTPDPVYLKTNMDNMMNVELRIVAELGKTPLKMSEILNLKTDSVINLNRPAGAPVEIIANKQPIGTGDVLVIGDNFYIRIVEIHNDLKPKRKK